MNPLAEILETEVALLSLELSRVAGVVVAAPLPWMHAPRRVRASFVLLLVLVVHGQAVRPEGLDAGTWAGGFAIVTEFLAGVAIGLVVLAVIAAFETAANAIAPIMGFGAGQIFNPATGVTDTTLAQLFHYLALLLALASGLHRVLLGSLLASFRAVPVGTLSSPELSAPLIIDMTANVLLIGVRLALPVLVVLVMVQVALGFVARAAPAMQIFNVGFAVLLAVGALVLILALPDLGRELLVMMSRTGFQIEELLLAMSGK